MKKIICLLSIALLTVSFTVSAQKKYMKLSGKITHKNSDSLIVRSKTYSKKIKVNENGIFSDTLKVVAGTYNLFDGKESTNVYLKNGFDIHMTIDTKQFDETVSYTGYGAEGSNYLAKMTLLNEQEFSDQTMFDLDKEAFDKKSTSIINKFEELLKNTKNLDSDFSAQQAKQLEGLTKYLENTYEQRARFKTVLGKGKESPKFMNYENHKGGTTSLDDLKGKYVYIDVWATWCGPCKAEIPFLKEVEKQYHDKNIAFVSISADKITAHDTWKKMIQEKELSGIQLFSDADFNSSFLKSYKINSIPRFILIDPNGNIISADAPRPSDKKLIDLFTELKI